MNTPVSSKNDGFFENVYDVVRLIPKGRVTSYGAIAKYLAAPRSSRMVGWAMNNAHSYHDVPAHRVVNRNGVLTGQHHFSEMNPMEKRLLEEGIKVKDNAIVNFDNYFWDPSLELTL